MQKLLLLSPPSGGEWITILLVFLLVYVLPMVICYRLGVKRGKGAVYEEIARGKLNDKS